MSNLFKQKYIFVFCFLLNLFFIYQFYLQQKNQKFYQLSALISSVLKEDIKQYDLMKLKISMHDLKSTNKEIEYICLLLPGEPSIYVGSNLISERLKNLNECENGIRYSNLYHHSFTLDGASKYEIKIKVYRNPYDFLKVVLNPYVIFSNLIFILFFGLLLKLYEYKQNKAESEALVKVASQVSHDIRSPLAALNMITRSLQDLPEDKRLIIRNSTQRINDIANDLLSMGKKITNSKNADTSISISNNTTECKKISKDIILLQALIDSIVSEKRIQYRDQMQIHILSDFKNSFSNFIIADSKELMRVLSNLINNSVEALANKAGDIIVSIDKNSKLVYNNKNKNTDELSFVLISIKDNGKGIPPNILEKLGQPGFTHGKEGTQSGSGIGIYHAKKTIEELGGQFKISSQVGSGTEIQIYLPNAKAPLWFLETLKFPNGSQIISLDDDISIHQIWEGRLSSLNANFHQIKLNSFTSASEFKKYIHNCSANDLKNKLNSQYYYLIDYELLGQNTNGLKLIEDLGLKNNVTLVTSRYEELQIQNKCLQLGIKLLPKQLAGFVPIEFANSDGATFINNSSELTESLNSQNKNLKTDLQSTNFSNKELVLYDWVLIDDDPIVHATWQIMAQEKNKLFLGFKSYSEFQQKKDTISTNSNIFIDSNLGNGFKGEELGKSIFDQGFSNLYLSTGYEADQFANLEYFKSVVGKEPPIY